MFQQVEKWNRQMKKWLWLVVIVGLVAAIPVAVQRVQTEQSANKVEIVFNYRNLVDMSALMPKPNEFIDEQLGRLKDAGVHTMALFESNLSDLKAARRLLIYNSSDAATLQKKLPPLNENYTYLLFTSSENEQKISPMIEKTFLRLGVEVRTWQHEDRNGLILETPVESAVMKSMPQDPITIQKLVDKGYTIMPRLSDSSEYDQEQMDELLQYYNSLGVTRILFDGDAVKGFNDDAEKKSLTGFADLLNKHNIGIAAIEGLKKPQQGMNKLAYLTKYNVVRLHSINDQESFNEIDVLADRFSLATKDRNIRMIYLNAAVKKDIKKSEIVTSIDNLIHSLKEPGDAIASIERNGFTMGTAEPFTVFDASWQKIAKIIVVIGGVALIALMLSYFVPVVMLPVFVLGLIGSAGMYVLKPAFFEQVLALGVAISAPTIAMVLAVRRVDMSPPVTSFKARFGKSVGLFLRTTVLSLMAIPFVIALLNNITYSLVINQFRGVSLLHFLPIGLTALYIFLYRGDSVVKEANRWLKMPVTVLMVVAAGVAGVVGMYYLSRTGNAGNVSSLEKSFRSLLENTLGVRPRNKEFLMAHPLFLIAAFAAYRYRIALYAFIIAVIGQLSMVDTFAHIHTPIIMSTIRTLLGLGLGLVIGIIGIFVWTIIERCWDAWRPKLQE
ncbi:hypothetical protein AZ66_06720 [Paenibacillus sp. E194]|uniref:DUF5693 family protein n=1 Tax=Paenibacillus sp. E194 TaxID=1458845 RepID=UPI0005C95317|nr:DUF5693 family protein [Paenibacillus sp. E194]KJB88563.1 hypothetical protein AZ66_06720 [Paenibacillus sp. E194]